jgi:hypothetical protein
MRVSNDRVSGGGFGFGLNEHVIDAYEWLIENYSDGDEIYLFGFSRGAYTARSLGGLIMKCGLLWPGAPLTVEQLWNGYRVMGRYREPETEAAPKPNWWERQFGQEPLPFRSLIELKWDTGKERVDDPNRTEKFLMEWSRRIPIHCIGVFDTVGAMGWDAMAVPGLRTHVAAFHNTNLSRLIRHGFHALAIDEHRQNFKNVPWRCYIPHGSPETDKWKNIEQRWFVGAHANIGGGYEDNPLLLFPLTWMMERTAKVGLTFRNMLSRPPVTDCVPLQRVQPAAEAKQGKTPYLRNSYGEFLSGACKYIPWTHPYYRPIDPPADTYENYSLKSVNEVLDESVAEFWKADSEYRPKNLADYFSRPGNQTPN